jgi:hypothetical protein
MATKKSTGPVPTKPSAIKKKQLIKDREVQQELKKVKAQKQIKSLLTQMHGSIKESVNKTAADEGDK